MPAKKKRTAKKKPAKKKTKSAAKAKGAAKTKGAAKEKPAPKSRPAAGKKAAAATRAATSTKPFWQKLGVKSGAVRVLNVPRGYEDAYAGSPASISADEADVVHLWAQSHDELAAHLPTALGSILPDGKLFISYPKGKSDIHRDTLWKALQEHGWEANGLVAVDEMWSAMRFKRA